MGLFVSSVEGRPVHRFSSGGQVLIGADRDPANPRKIIYRTDEVVEIPDAEAARYAREYARAIADGDLVAHEAKAVEAQNEEKDDAPAADEAG